jgi:membrane-associated phospholipid phosphatase
VRAWAAFVAATQAFNAVRGWIYLAVTAGIRPEFTGYVIRLERLVTGGPALPLVAQRFSPLWLDGVATLFHLSHFVYFFAIGAAIWVQDRHHGRWWQRAMMASMVIGLVGYFAVPTVPPWLAAERGALPPVNHTTALFYARFMPQLYRTFDTNPVAAMPSLHAAFPLVCALIAARVFHRSINVVLWLYTAGACAAAVYLGEHYFVDVLAGIATGWVAVWLTRPRTVVRPILP